jgi:hypothetical protein
MIIRHSKFIATYLCKYVVKYLLGRARVNVDRWERLGHEIRCARAPIRPRCQSLKHVGPARKPDVGITCFYQVDIENKKFIAQ